MLGTESRGESGDGMGDGGGEVLGCVVGEGGELCLNAGEGGEDGATTGGVGLGGSWAG